MDPEQVEIKVENSETPSVSQIQQHILESIQRQISESRQQESGQVPFNDYKHLLRDIYKLRLRRETSVNKEPSNENVLDTVLKFQEQARKFEEERNFFKATAENLKVLLEKEVKEKVKLSEEYDYLNDLFQKTMDEKRKVEDALVKVSQERDYAEAVLIRKNVELADIQNQMNDEMKELLNERKMFEQQKKELNAQKMYLKKLLNSGNLGDLQEDVALKMDDHWNIDEVLTDSKISGDKSKSNLLKSGYRYTLKSSVQVHKPIDKNVAYSIMSLAMSQSGRFVASSGMDQVLSVAETLKGLKSTISFSNSNGLINDIIFFDKESLIATGTQKNLVEVFCLRKAKKISSLLSHTEPVNVVRQIDENRLISGSMDRTAKLWDLKKNCFERSLIFSSSVLSLETTQSTAYTCHYDGNMRVSSFRDKKQISEHKLFSNPLNFCKMSPDGNSLFLASRDKDFKIFDLRMMKTYKEHSIKFQGLAASARTTYGIACETFKLFAGTTSGSIKAFDTMALEWTAEDEIKLGLNPVEVPFVAFSDAMDCIVAADFDGYLHLVSLTRLI